MKQLFKNRRFFLCLKSVCIFFWLTFLRKSDAYCSPYLLLGITGILCLLSNFRRTEQYGSKCGRHGKGTVCFEYSIAVLFSLAVSAANYRLFSEPDLSYMTGKTARFAITAVAFLLFSAGGFWTMHSILRYLRCCGITRIPSLIFPDENAGSMQSSDASVRLSGAPEQTVRPVRRPVSSGAVFWIVAALLAAAYCLVLFLAKYPGVLTEDSISQMEQLLSGVYSNHHPFYHTMLIKLCVSFGLRVFGEINAAVSVYSVMQILLMACTFAFLISTLHAMKVKKHLLIILVLWFMLLPCHFMYSFSMWKDVPFAAALTVFLIALYRRLNGIGRQSVWSRILLTLSAIGVCLLRSNGWAIFLTSFLFFLFMFGKQQKKLCILFLVVLIVSYVMKHPVLDALGVSTADTVEALSIPVQQVARVIDECKDELTEEQRALLDQIVDVDRVPIYYSEFISNPVKELVRETGNQEYLREHASEFFKLYLELGRSHPRQYFEAYVEQTKGYWNSGYNYWITTEMVADNSLNIAKTVVSKPVNSLIEQYVYLFSSSEFLAMFQSIGLHVWMIIVAGYVAVCRRERSAFFLTVPLVMNIVSLLIATPVFAEFRYTYSLFCIFPFVMLAPFYRKKEIGSNG